MLKKKFNKNISVALVLGTMLLSGCSATRQASNDYKATGDIAGNYANAGSNVAPADLFSKSSDFYVDKKPITTIGFDDSAQKLPAMFQQKASMNIQSATPLSEIAARITRISGKIVNIQQDVLDGTAGEIGQMIGNKGGATAGGSAGGGSSSSSSGEKDPLIVSDVVFDGNLAGLLDVVTGKLNLAWRWDGQQIQIYRYETKMFRLNALAGVAQMTASLNTASSTNGSGGGDGTTASANQTGTSGQNTQIDAVTSIWEDVGAALQASLSPKGTMSMVPSAGTITVKDTANVLRTIESQVSEYNKIYAKQVLLNVQVYQVERSDEDDYGVDWDAAWKWAGGKYGISVSSTGNTSGSGTTFKVSGSGGSLQSANAAIQALSTLGKTSLVTSGSVISLNGQTVPLNVSREVAYLQSSSTTVSGDSGVSSSTLTPGLVTEGFAMNFTPRVTDGNNIIMRYTVDLSSIEKITDFSTPDGTSTIQLPQRLVRNFMQNVSVKSGETLVLTGFQQVGGTDTSSGTGASWAWFLGGSKKANSTNRTIVIVVTPFVTQ